MTLRDIVAENLRFGRLRLGLTQTAVARKVRVSVSYISMLESGQRSPPLPLIEKLAKAVDVTPIFLCEEQKIHRNRRRREGRSR